MKAEQKPIIWMLFFLLSSESELISFNEDSDNADMIEADGTQTFTFDIDVSEDATIGDVAQFNLFATADNDFEMNENFSLTIGLIFDDFETGDFTQMPWEFSGDQPWEITGEAYEGEYAAKSGGISDNQETSIFIELYATQDDEIRFWKKVSSESNYDHFTFYINDEEMDSWSGDVAWSEEVYPVSEGPVTFKWTYDKDSSVSSGEDCAWIDEIIFPPSIVPQPAELVVGTTEIDMEMTPDATGNYTFTLENAGDLPLSYSIGIQNTTDEEGRDLTGSTVSCDAEGFYPGETVTWTFTVECVSVDNEWIKVQLVSWSTHQQI